MGVKVLSLFDGMACGMLAMQKAGVDVEEYTAYEVDKHAIKTATHNFPMIKECGDVFKADFTQYKDIDYVLAGFPCTKFSIAQKNNRETKPYSGEGWDLFEQAWRAVKEANPKYFLFENNKSMAKEVQNEISKIVGFEPICINSALVSAQNRQRLYWVGKRNANGTYSKVDVKQPKDRGILLKDVLDGVTDRDKGRAVIGSTGRTTTREYFIKSQGNMSFKSVRVGALPRPNGELSTSQAMRVYSTEGKSVNLVSGGGMGGKTGLYAVPIKVGEVGNGGQGNRIYSVEGKSVSQTATSGGLGSNTGLYAIPVEFENDKPIKATSCADGKTYTVYEVKDGLITIKGKQYPIKLIDGYYIIRKLTVSECKRLQTVPEWYEFPVSDTQAYKMLGNGWSVDVIVHLIESTLNC
jgi:DNA (cytosine-5)-methyltransferase 3A